jgi:hypothetical protein
MPRTEEQYRYFKQWRIDRARGIQRTLDVTEVRRHIAQQASRHLPEGAKPISRSVVHRIEKGHQARVRPSIGRALMQVAPADLRADSPDDETFVPKVGAQRRVQALLWLGWRYQDMEALIDGPMALSATILSAGRWVTARNHERIKAMYDQLCMSEGPSRKTRTIARQKGYAPPLAWDEDTIDDPEATPDIEWLVARVLEREPDVLEAITPDDRDRIIRSLHYQGYADTVICELVFSYTRPKYVELVRQVINSPEEQAA